jgi:hypothetical protein
MVLRQDLVHRFLYARLTPSRAHSGCSRPPAGRHRFQQPKKGLARAANFAHPDDLVLEITEHYPRLDIE